MIDNKFIASTAAIETNASISDSLNDLDFPLYVVGKNGSVDFIKADQIKPNQDEEILAWLPSLAIEKFGDPAFKKTHRVKYAYYAGAMANGIASADMVIALGQAGFFGSFGSAGISITKLEAAINTIQAALPNGPYAFNLLNSPNEDGLERKTIDLYLKHDIHLVEAAGYMDLSIPLIRYRTIGLSLQSNGEVRIANRIIAKVSRTEVAEKFMQPAPENLLSKLLEDGSITHQQAELARQLPVADDITIEADSGGHTDNRPLVCLLPSMLLLRDQIQAKHHYASQVRIGAAGGISTPTAVLAAFLMGADYIVTGSINQACVESGASEHTKKLLSQARMTDVAMAPAADMFEIGAKVQVLKLGTLYPMRAQKLYELYTRYDSIDLIPNADQEKLRKQIFQRDIASIWQEIVSYFDERDSTQIERAESNPKHKMALLFRWYLGLSSRWSISGDKGREMDYQIWCGPSMGCFNDWARGTYLEAPENRHVVDIALQLLTGAAYQLRIQILRASGIDIPDNIGIYYPTAFKVNNGN